MWQEDMTGGCGWQRWNDQAASLIKQGEVIGGRGFGIVVNGLCHAADIILCENGGSSNVAK
jgi:hypothetical protein